MDQATFIQEITLALQQQEVSQSPPPSAADNDLIIEQTYRNFLFDDPVIVAASSSVSSIHLLGHALISPTSNSYALSQRLVTGVHAVHQKYHHHQHHQSPSTTATATIHTKKEGVNEEEEEEDNNTIRSTLPAASLLRTIDTNDTIDTNHHHHHHHDNTTKRLVSALAELLYVIHIQLPLICCRSTTTLSEAQRYLGSFLTTTSSSSNNSNSTMDVTSTTPTPAPSNPHHHDNTNDEDDHNHHEDTPPPLHDSNGNNGHAHHDDHDSLEERFAAESDESDYEYEGLKPSANVVVPDQSWLTTLSQAYDPRHLSQPNPITTWEDVATAVRQLLHPVVVGSSSSFLTSISPVIWKQRQYSEPLLQLCVALLIPASSQQSPILNAVRQQQQRRRRPEEDVSHDDDDNNNNEHESVEASSWQPQLGVQLMRVFRDVIVSHLSPEITGIHHRDRVNHDDNDVAVIAMLEDYLRLIRILLLPGGDKPPPPKIPNPLNHSSSFGTSSPPAILVGLSSLSALCHEISVLVSPQGSQPVKRQVDLDPIVHIIQCSVIDLCHEWTDLLVQSLQKPIEDLVVIQWAYVSLFRILVQPTRQSMGTNGSAKHIMSNDNAQPLLNSGWFRQWLITWSHLYHAPPSSGDDIVDTSAVGTAVQQCIFDLCVASPSLLGKYAWRFPSFTEMVLTPPSPSDDDDDDDDDDHNATVHGLFWNLLGMYYTCATSATSTPTVQWKNPSNVTRAETPPVTKGVWASRAWMQFRSVCTRTCRVLTDWNIRREHDMENDPKTPSQLQWIVNDWNQLEHSLSTHPFLCQLFFEMVEQQKQQHDNHHSDKSGHSAGTTLRTELMPIQRLLMLRQSPASQENGIAESIPTPGEPPPSPTVDVNPKPSIIRTKDDIEDSDDTDDDKKDANDWIIVKKKREQKNRRDQEMKWIAHLRKSLKVILTTIDDQSVGTSERINPPNYGTSTLTSNKTD